MIFIWDNLGAYSMHRLWIVEAPDWARPLFDDGRIGRGDRPLAQRSRLLASAKRLDWLSGFVPATLREWAVENVVQGLFSVHGVDCEADFNGVNSCSCEVRPIIDLARKLGAITDEDW